MIGNLLDPFTGRNFRDSFCAHLPGLRWSTNPTTPVTLEVLRKNVARSNVIMHDHCLDWTLAKVLNVFLDYHSRRHRDPWQLLKLPNTLLFALAGKLVWQVLCVMRPKRTCYARWRGQHIFSAPPISVHWQLGETAVWSVWFCAQKYYVVFRLCVQTLDWWVSLGWISGLRHQESTQVSAPLKTFDLRDINQVCHNANDF